jgi:SAM-dependent methyltransferase
VSPRAGGDIVRRGWSRLRTTGPRGSLTYLRHLISERYYEARLGVRTAGPAKTAAVAQRPGLCKPYAPIPYRSFFAVMREVEIRPGKDVFLDYGAGRGRALVLAARLPFRRVLGAEIEPGLAEAARENIRRVSRHLRCRNVEIVTADAAEFGCPDDATVLHFFDPFAGVILEQVIENVRVSLRRAPRRLTILFADPNHFAPLAAASDWLVKRCEVPYPLARGAEPIRESYYVYEGRPGREVGARRFG